MATASSTKAPSPNFQPGPTIEDPLAILILVPGGKGRRLAGPQIRGLELARALAGRHRVTVAFRGAPIDLPEEVRVVRPSRWRVLWEALSHDAVMAPWLPPFLLPVLGALGVVAVADLYDPVEHELAAADHDVSGELASVRRLTALQLRFASLVSCGGARQRDRLIEEAARIRDGARPLPVVTVPFGVPEAPPRASGHSLRESLGLGPSDLVLLWWGSVWRWLDPGTAIRAMALLRARIPDLRLVITAGIPPDPASRALLDTRAARDLAASLQLLDETVFFLDSWIPYETRHELLADADLGIALHAGTEEARQAARARYLDYLWCSLPCVLSSGDEFAATLAAAGFATLVEPGNVDATAKAIGRLAADPSARQAAANAGEALAGRYRWPAVAEPLAAAIRDSRGGDAKPRWRLSATLPAVLGFYARRALGLIAGLAGRRRSSRQRSAEG